MIDAVLPPFLTQLSPGDRTPCHGQQHLFVSSHRDTPAQTAVEQARALCTQCPVQTACASWAVTTAQSDGVWGGLTPAERATIRAPRPECGSETAWRSHRARGESCIVCREAHDERLRAGRLARLASEHREQGGSLAGYRLELLLGLPTCVRCRAVRQAYYDDRPRPQKWYRRSAA